MLLSLLQPIDATIVPSSYPAPVAPDSFVCDGYYSYPTAPQRADCQIAFEQLSTGSEDEPFSYHFPTDDPNRLPIIVEHGTCEIWFHTSGESSEDRDPIVINPEDIRNMAGWVLDQCVSDQKLGGAIMKGVSRATDWILNPRSDFPRYPMPPSTTFYSLNVWNNDELTTEYDWNPGNFDPHLGLDIAKYIGDVAQRAPEGSALRHELERRHDLLMEAASRMEGGTDHAWWDCDPLLNAAESNSSILAPRGSLTTRRISERRGRSSTDR